MRLVCADSNQSWASLFIIDDMRFHAIQLAINCEWHGISNTRLLNSGVVYFNIGAVPA